MQQLLPAEQDPKDPPQKADPTPKTPKDSPEKQAGKQSQRSSVTAKASTPRRQDQVTTKSTGPKSSEKSRQDQNRAHGGRQDANRHQQVSPCAFPVHVQLACASPAVLLLHVLRSCMHILWSQDQQELIPTGFGVQRKFLLAQMPTCHPVHPWGLLSRC